MTVQTHPDTRLRGRWLMIARLVWVALAALALGLFFVGARAVIGEPPPICTTSEVECDPLEFSVEDLEMIRVSGLPVAILASLDDSYLLIDLAFFSVAALIIWRRSDDWMALLLSVTMITLGAALFGPAGEGLPSNQLVLTLAADLLGGLSLVFFFLLLYLFPDGRFVPRWTWLMVALVGVGQLLSELSIVGFLVDTFGFVFPIVTGVYAQIYRYRQVSGAAERQQTKWVAFGLMGILGGIVVWILIGATFPPEQPSIARSYLLLIATPVSLLLGMLFPFATLFAILRYRLWDIDVVINRTLVYGALTAALAAVYFGSVVLLQGLFRILTGQEQNQLVTVISTLAIAALFTPLRRRLQAAIDHRFYRRKYDAGKTLEAFGAMVRDEVDPDRLSERLVAVVQETMQPAQVSLWLKNTGGKRDA